MDLGWISETEETQMAVMRQGGNLKALSVQRLGEGGHAQCTCRSRHLRAKRGGMQGRRRPWTLVNHRSRLQACKLQSVALDLFGQAVL